MAKRKKSGGKRKGRKRGMGAVPGGAIRKGLLFLTTVAAANLADEGFELLYAQDFMNVTATADKPAPKINVKKAGASGSAFLLAGAGALMIKNEWVGAIATGAGVSASKYLKDDLVKPVLGLGEVSDFLNLYKKDKTIKGDPRLAGEPRLAGDESAIKFG